ncbi:hypothetical protein SOV_35410 [Sporomusa ovata DSM 2662]|uniref:hypothetical protein n=1 Tax=Sporomusa ovata TaxID=2378 RepID=UPI000388283A|nr:hypothetical protein [Sporomusa ovata]EQB24690.1 hypothetical protein SOV_6c01040 [Sporomusa ovata DSM 2662]
MKIWRWFCSLGAYKKTNLFFGRVKYKGKFTDQYSRERSGVESVCTRLNGNAGCQCGSTMRGLHCIWSYYRMN